MVLSAVVCSYGFMHVHLFSLTCFPVAQAVIFVDNSGADIILGILPFARELLRHGVEV